MKNPDLSAYNNSWYNPGGTATKRLIWYFVNALIYNNSLLPIYGLKVRILRWFGASIGKGVVIKPSVNIKYPWKLSIGDNTWIGENVWIDNLGQVNIGSNCCLSQGVMLLCGNHNYKKTTFDLMVGDITICDGAWIGAQSLVCPGVTVGSCAVLSAMSMASSNLEDGFVYAGRPAVKLKPRIIE